MFVTSREPIKESLRATLWAVSEVGLRFDDTLETVLASDLETPHGVQSAWRQLVDLVGRRRVVPGNRALAVLESIRDRVPLTIRVASARALESADPPPALVRLFARDEVQVALPVLRTARMSSAEWVALLPALAPAGRAVLRNRRDLGPVVKRALESFGPVDFVLPDESGAIVDAAPESRPALPSLAALLARLPDATVRADHEGEGASPIEIPPHPGEDETQASLGGESLVSPIQSGTDASLGEPHAIAPGEGEAHDSLMDEGNAITAEAAAAGGGEADGTFEIAEVVARIDAFWRHREEGGAAPSAPRRMAEDFRFETDASGVIRWVDGVSRAPVIGVSLDSASLPRAPGAARVDGIAAGAFRRRAEFGNARLSIGGDSEAAGDWLISALPAFDPSNGRFTGYRGTARRPRADERAEPVRPANALPADSLRQLVHELRTPTNAIAGFAEMIESQMLGPVSDPYRNRAQTIRGQARELLGAIDDLDLAARIDSAALALVPGQVALREVLAGIADDLAPLAELRGSVVSLPVDDQTVIGDRRAVERLLARLLATLVSASARGERIGVRMAPEPDGKIAITIDRPRALADYPGDSVLGIDDEREDATLLGTGFALRLARNLARELGGSLVIGPESLTLRLPAAVTAQVGQAHLN